MAAEAEARLRQPLAAARRLKAAAALLPGNERDRVPAHETLRSTAGERAGCQRAPRCRSRQRSDEAIAPQRAMTIPQAARAPSSARTLDTSRRRPRPTQLRIASKS